MTILAAGISKPSEVFRTVPFQYVKVKLTTPTLLVLQSELDVLYCTVLPVLEAYRVLECAHMEGNFYPNVFDQQISSIRHMGGGSTGRVLSTNV